MLDELSGGLALGLAHGLDDASLGHPTEIVVERSATSLLPQHRARRLRRCGRREPAHAAADSRARSTALTLSATQWANSASRLSGSNAQSASQRSAGLARQLLGPAPMPFVDGLGNCAVIETGRLASRRRRSSRRGRGKIRTCSGRTASGRAHAMPPGTRHQGAAPSASRKASVRYAVSSVINRSGIGLMPCSSSSSRSSGDRELTSDASAAS